MLAFVWLPAALLLRVAFMGECSANATDLVGNDCFSTFSPFEDLRV